MVNGFPLVHVLMLTVVLISIALPFLIVTHTRHARALMAATILLTIICLVLSWLFNPHVSERSDLVLLRCYAFCSALCSLADELLSSARDEKTPMRGILLALFGVLFLLTLVFLIGGISGTF